MTSTPSAVGSYLPVPTLLRAFLAVCLIAILGSLGGCVSAAEHKQLQTAYDEARDQLARSENDNKTMRDQIDVLNGRIRELTALLDSNTSSMGALNALQARLAELQNKYDELLKMSSQPTLPIGISSLLRDLAAQYPNLMEFDERLGMIRLKSDVTFAKGSTEVSPAAKGALQQLAQILDKPEIENNEIQVVGHTDDIPITPGGPMSTRNPDNWTLSTNRAWSVMQVLHEAGVKANRGMASGWGDQRPVVENAAGHGGAAANRRVDIYIRPTQVPPNIVVSTPGSAARPAASRPAATRPAAAPGGVPIPR